MTCIVGYIDKKSKKTIIGSDSAAVDGFEVTVRKDTKVFKNGDFIIGCTSSFRMIQLLRFAFTPPEVNKKDVYEYMCIDFVNEVRKCFEFGGYLQKDTKGDEIGGQFLVGYKDRLFMIDEDFQVGEYLSGMHSVGCGAPYAIGALYSISDQNISPKKKVEIALRAAECYSGGVISPFNFETT